MRLACYFDFTCGYSYLAWAWFDRLRDGGIGLDIDWLPFVLKEINRDEGEASLLERPTIDSVAVLALALAEALRGLPGADRYRSETFRAMHETGERPGRDDVLRIAATAGLDPDQVVGAETQWLGLVRKSHHGAISEHGVFGTPTLIFPDGSSVYLKLDALPDGDDGALWTSLSTIASDFPELAELKRPLRAR